jgi:hypothetical protein
VSRLRIKNEWSSTFTPLTCHGVDRDSFIFYFENEVTALKKSSSSLANGRRANKFQALNKQNVVGYYTGCYTGCSEFAGLINMVGKFRFYKCRAIY